MLDQLKNASYSVLDSSGRPAEEICLIREWEGPFCRLSLENPSAVPVPLKEAAVFILSPGLPANTSFYGEGYNMLTQYRGSMTTFENITGLNDHGHYRFPREEGFFTVYNLLHFFTGGDAEKSLLLAFTSCRRFSGSFRFNMRELKIVISLENQVIDPGGRIQLEELMAVAGPREDVLERLGRRISENHPRLQYPEMPKGWCSWYCYGSSVTERDIFANLAEIRSRLPEVKFVQLDDGYQKKMGDWLIPSPNFPGGIRELCLAIKKAGFEPAIWVAPFIAEESSELFQQHPDWFVMDEDGHPLRSDRVTFGGWRHGPWYMLDGTNPGARNYLRNVFRTMREDWQCSYFKLDANMWGAMPFGRRFQSRSTCIEGYRLGMQAVLEGAGAGSFILGCNAPMWPSLGLVHGMRITGDISRRWKVMGGIAEECFWRNWQHNHLWYNDPDCVVLKNLITRSTGPDGSEVVTETAVSEDEFSFHRAHILASGGMVLSSDRVMELEPRHLAVLKKLFACSGRAARFDDTDFRIGRIAAGEDLLLLCLFNRTDRPLVHMVPLDRNYDIQDFWTEEVLAENTAMTPEILMPPRSGRVLVCRCSRS